MMDIRWKQRLDNYTKMLSVLNENLNDSRKESYTDLELIGLGKSFELSFELMWKLIKDYLEEEEVEIGLLSPRNVMKIAAEVGLLEQMNVEGKRLIDALKVRNELTHIYDKEKFLLAITDIRDHYLGEMNKVEIYFSKRI
jgi:nucleotidyltransferase substrate binding protein (TIGR01987 family)